MMILVEGELKLCDRLVVKEGVRIGVWGNFLFYFFIFFYDSFTKKFFKYLLGCVMLWVSV